jgi:hypothetical protein
MKLCSTGHKEVCYDGWYCPCCYEISAANMLVIELNRRIKELELLITKEDNL